MSVGGVPETDAVLGSGLVADDPAVEVVPELALVEEVPVADPVEVSVLEVPVEDVVTGGGSIFIPLIWV